jgi:hypothetical protein
VTSRSPGWCGAGLRAAAACPSASRPCGGAARRRGAHASGPVRSDDDAHSTTLVQHRLRLRAATPLLFEGLMSPALVARQDDLGPAAQLRAALERRSDGAAPARLVGAFVACGLVEVARLVVHRAPERACVVQPLAARVAHALAAARVAHDAVRACTTRTRTQCTLTHSATQCTHAHSAHSLTRSAHSHTCTYTHTTRTRTYTYTYTHTYTHSATREERARM